MRVIAGSANFDSKTAAQVAMRLTNTDRYRSSPHGLVAATSTWMYRFDQPGWAPYDTASRTTGVLTHKITPVDDRAGDERALWERIR